MTKTSSTTQQNSPPLEQILAMLKSAAPDLIIELNRCRARIHSYALQLAKTETPDCYKDGVLEVVNASGEIGVSTADLHEAFPNGKLLTKARKELEEAGQITATKAGMAWLLQKPAAKPKSKLEKEEE